MIVEGTEGGERERMRERLASDGKSKLSNCDREIVE